MNTYRAGIDIGSTTVKLVLLDEEGKLLFGEYRRHCAHTQEALSALLREACEQVGDCALRAKITGSGAINLAKALGIPFVQEVVAVADALRREAPQTDVAIELGGEDAKIIYFGTTLEERMNGVCAGGTGSFIDQMAALLQTDAAGLDREAEKYQQIYPIAARCGVFAKTDIQPLINEGATKADLAASIFQAVVNQTISGLACGKPIRGHVAFLGGPLHFLPQLKAAFIRTLKLTDETAIDPPNSHLFAAMGAALDETACEALPIASLIDRLTSGVEMAFELHRLPALFASQGDYDAFCARHARAVVEKGDLASYTGGCFLGVDAGSTTTKLALIGERGELLWSYYANNQGSPIETAKRAVSALARELPESAHILRECSTGYGEALLKAAFSLDEGEVETIAHCTAAAFFDPQVDCVLDIGGQDMKCIKLHNGSVDNVLLNEACSSGCGSFIENFAASLGYSAEDFAKEALFAPHPVDLGTRCTVFMNSKVKQCLREGAGVPDIAAGLSFSIVKNCLHKVLKIRDVSELGDNIVVQGGTFRNLSVVRAFEVLTGKSVVFTNMPELMGAYGCALVASEHFAKSAPAAANEDADAAGTPLERLARHNAYKEKQLTCPGCTNRCQVREFLFDNGNTYYSGNKCEKIFTNKGGDFRKGENMYAFKYSRIFRRCAVPAERAASSEKNVPAGTPKRRIGIPRALNAFENFPFWNALLTECGFDVVLSATSTMPLYEKGLHSVMSDNICFPAKLTHGHVLDLVNRKVERIFMPYVVRERMEDKEANGSFNCPIVSSYSQVIASAMETREKYGVPLDSPVVTFSDEKLLRRACYKYLHGLGVPKHVFEPAFSVALNAQRKFTHELCDKAKSILENARKNGRMTLLLAGRPYHTDPLVQHKISDMAADFGADVVTEDVVRFSDDDALDGINGVLQWTYVTRILKAARFVAEADASVHYVQMTSFGCGPDAFIIDEVSDILRRGGKNITILKIDDVNNVGSLKLRLRSLIESLKFKSGLAGTRARRTPPKHTAVFRDEDRRRTILYPFISGYLSPIIKPALESCGYKAVMLPPSDEQTVEYGLKHSNNEICYPATLCVGDIVKALDSGKYDRDEVAVGISQTGGQCRATNYLTLIKKALANAGYGDVPVVALGVGTSPINDQPGMRFSLSKIAKRAVSAIVFGDCISQMYYSTVVREQVAGTAAKLRDSYMAALIPCVRWNRVSEMFRLLRRAAEEFDAVPVRAERVPAIGIVGEIFVKYNSFSHKNVVSWLVENGVEPIIPNVTDFMIQDIVNNKINVKLNLAHRSLRTWGFTLAFSMIARSAIAKADRACRAFRRYRPFGSIEEKAKKGGAIVNLAAQFGEGWLIPAEFASFAEHGVNNAVSLQPFGCIANHIVAKGVEKRVKRLYPKMNLLFLDFDSGTSEANVLNRLHFMIKNARDELARADA